MIIKKIRTQQEIDRVKKRNQIITGVVLMGLMLLSTIGYSFFSVDDTSSGNGKVKESGLEFSKVNGGWITKINGLDFNFQFLPSEVKDIPVTTSFTLSDYTGKTVYFVNSGSIASEILSNLNSYILRAQEACLKGEPCGKDLPIKDCSEKLIVYKEGKEGSEANVYQDQNCVYLEGESIKAADAFLYKILGVN